MSEYVVIYEQADDGGWGAYIPDLPGVVAVGRRAPWGSGSGRPWRPTPKTFATEGSRWAPRIT
jgi:hypothetical protein